MTAHIVRDTQRRLVRRIVVNREDGQDQTSRFKRTKMRSQSSPSDQSLYPSIALAQCAGNGNMEEGVVGGRVRQAELCL